MFSRQALILLLALACSSVIVLFDDQINLKHYLTYLSDPIKPSKEKPKPPPPSNLNETSLIIPVQKMKRKTSTVYYIEMKSSSKTLKFALDSVSTNENYYYNILMICCSDTKKEDCIPRISCLNETKMSEVMIIDNHIQPVLATKYPHIHHEKFSIGDLFFSKNKTVLINAIDTNSDYWNGLDGSIGLGYPKKAKETSIFQLIKFNYEYYQQFALDFTLPNHGKMIFGPALKDYKFSLEDILWSEKQFKHTNWLQTNAGLIQSLVIYDFSFCGTNLFSNYSSNWQASINTLIDGIAVPQEFYKMIMSWIQERNISSNFDPVLEFQLSPKVNSFKFKIPISHLYDNETGKLMIYSSGKMKYHFSSLVGVPVGDPLIELGTKFLELYYTVFDIENHRIGFYPSNFTYTDTVCQSNEKKCFGLQEYYAAGNVCIDPKCSDYMFQYLDHITKQCYFSWEIYFIFGSLVLIFAFVELFLFEAYKRVSVYLEND
eukprot:gene5253-8864_t